MPTTDTLLADLLHPDKNVRIAAALALGTAADPAALPVLVDRLGAEPDFFVRENVTWALARLGTHAVPPMLQILASDGAPAARVLAAHVLGKIADPASLPALVEALYDADDALVQKAAYSLGRIGDPRAVPALVALLPHAATELRGTIADALQAIGPQAVPAVATSFAGADAALRVTLTEVVTAMDGDEATALLCTAARDAAAEVRFAAVLGLRERADEPAAAQALAAALDDTDERVRLLARQPTSMRRVSRRRR